MTTYLLVGGYLEPFEWKTVIFKSSRCSIYVKVWSKHCQLNRSRQNFGFSVLVTVSNNCEFITNARCAELK
jgi:hypothetical protein